MSSNLRWIGPITVDYRDPQIKWTGARNGIRPMQMTGLIELSAAKQLLAMSVEPSAQVMIAGFEGILEWIEFDGDIVGEFKGLYVIERVDLGVNHRFSLGGPDGYTPFSMDAALLPGTP